MKKLLPVIILIVFYSCSSQKNASPVKSATLAGDSATASNQNETKSATPTKTAILNNPSGESNADKPSVTNPETKNNDLPPCINNLIEQYRKEDVQNPPRKIYSFNYNGKRVYYVTPPCCDFFSDLYDTDCNLIAHPDGGITGKGDGRAKDFSQTKTNEKLVWEDNRKK